MFASKDIFLTPPSGGYTIARSVRLRSSASAYLNRTPASAGNQQKFTWSGWVKLGLISDTTFVSLGTTLGVNLRFSSNQLQSNILTVGSTTSTAVYRDPSAWYHFVLAVDTTQASNNNRLRLYVNGSEVSYSANATITQNANLGANTTTLHALGAEARGGSASTFFDGYMTEINYIDGQQLTPSSFGTTNAITGVWQPTKYTGTYGTNGFYLNFSDNSSNTSTTIGKDYSGNGNNWTPNNISVTAGATYDSMTDVPTLTSATAANYCVLNPLDVNAVTSITEANLFASLTASGSAIVRSTIAVTNGKYYWEVTFGSTGDTLMVGVCDATTALTNSLWSTTNAWMYYSNNGNKYNSSSAAYGASFTNGDVIGVALDMDVGTLTFYKNNTSQGVAYSSGLTGKTLTPTIQSAARALTAYFNAGQRPFSYTPPTGFVALNTYNLPASTIKNGAAYMAATTYTGNGSTQSISNAVGSTSFQPDFVWIKLRNQAGDYHNLFDSVRGVYKRLFSNDTNAENTNTDTLTAFNSNGFSVGTNGNVNTNAINIIGWQWKAGTTSASNTNGSITSTVSVGATQGFSVVTYTGNGTAGSTVGHGLGVAPSLVIWKSRSAVANWYVWSKAMDVATGSTGFLYLNLTNSKQTSGSTNEYPTYKVDPTSTLLTLNGTGSSNGTNDSAATYVAYCFAAVAGYSAFGSYTGNGSTDGTFVYTGFRPRWILTKETSAAGNYWVIHDTSRDTYNAATLRLYPNVSDAEATATDYDILANGFKLRTTGTPNISGSTYIYACFAENPLKYALAR